MLILIEKDSATRIPKEVTPEQAEAFSRDFNVLVVNDDGNNMPFDDWKAAQPVVETEAAETVQVLDPGAGPTLPVETYTYNDGSAVTGTPPFPDLSPIQQDFGPSAFARSGLSEENWNTLSDDDRNALINAEAALINDSAASE